MDDSKDKVRRNLVVFCSLIIVASYLGIRLETPELPLIAGIKYQVPHPERIRDIFFVLHIYLSYRFFVLEETKTAFKNIKSAWIDGLRTKQNTRIDSAVRAAAQNREIFFESVQFTNLISAPLIPNDSPIKIINLEYEEKDSNLLWRMIAAVKYTVTFRFYMMAEGSDELIKLSERLNPNQLCLTRNGDELLFHTEAKIDLSRPQALLIFTVATFKTFFSWSFSELVFPFIFAAASLSILIRPA